MGKASRRSARKRRGSAENLAQVVVRVSSVADEAELRAFVRAERAHFAVPDLDKQIEHLGSASAYGPYVRRLAEVVEVALRDPVEAWGQLVTYKKHVDRTSKALGDAADEAEVRIARHDRASALEVATPALETARLEGFGGLVFLLASIAGRCYLELWGGDRSHEIERAGELFDEAVDAAPTAHARADALMHSALAWSERIEGDPDQHQRQSEANLRQALDLVDPGEGAHLRATIETNLGETLLRRRGADSVAFAREARDLALSALTTRSPATDVDDWAYSQLVLGRALLRLAEAGEGSIEEAQDALLEVSRQAKQLRNDALAPVAERSVADSLRRQSAVTGERAYEAHDKGELHEWWEQCRVTRAKAHAHYRRVLDLLAPSSHRAEIVRASLGWVATRPDDADLVEALGAARSAFDLASQLRDPPLMSEAAGAAAAIATELAEWELASDLYWVALGIDEIRLSRRIEPDSRAADAKSIGNAPRWAAFAMARAGRIEQAVEVLERSRSRDLARLRDASAYSGAGPENALVDELVAASRELARSGLGGAPTIERRYQLALDAIYREGDAAGQREVDVAALCGALENDWPVVYVNPTPAGTVLLKLDRGSDAASSATAHFIDDLTSTELYAAMSGVSEAEDAPTEMFALAGVVPRIDLARAIEEVCDWVGPRIAQQIDHLLTGAGGLESRGVTLVPCGPVGLIPLHAAPWGQGPATTTLLDRVAVCVAPSARAAISTEFGGRRVPSDPTFVALGDPDGTLPWARREVEMIAASSYAGRAKVALGELATTAFLADEAPMADVLHLACHGSGALIERESAALALADRPLSAAELSRLDLSHLSLATLSACQTALPSLADRPEESFSIATCLLAAGARCVIASLWSVPDLPTGLLMVDFYSRVTGGLSVAEALRAASLWLRTLTIDDVHAIVARTPALSSPLEEWERRDAGQVPNGTSSSSPFAHPYVWAGFVTHGVGTATSHD